MKQELATGKLYFVGTAVVLSEPYAAYKCLPELATVKAQIIPLSIGLRRDDGSQIDPHLIKYVDERSEVELTPVRILGISKHGISTIDSGGGSLEHLIVKDSEGVYYQLPTVYLGVNQGDEFLKLRARDGSETLLSADSKFSTQ